MITLPHPYFSGSLPYPIFFRTAVVPPEAYYPRQRHAWGEFVYSFSGLLEVKLADRQYLAPPQYGLWLTAGVEHMALNRQAACHCSLYVSQELCGDLPAETCALAISPLVRAMLEHLRANPPVSPPPDSYHRLLRTLVDQIAVSKRAGTYLPTSDDPLLGPVLRKLEDHPGDNRPVIELAEWVGTNERTLNRKCRRDLGMPLVEWRQRLRVVRAFTYLDEGWTVEAIARDLGYSGPSAFIVMFRKMVGTTPDEFRKSGRVE